MAKRKDDGISRLERAALVKKLRDQGMLQEDIGRELGISRSYVSALLSDPDGSWEARRKKRYYGTCPECGAPTSYKKGGHSRYCIKCTHKYRRTNRFWTREKMIAAIQEWDRIHGSPPTATQWLLDVRGDGTRNSRPYPHVAAVQKEFGSWSNGLEAAGFERRIGYPRDEAWRAKVTTWTEEKVIQALRDWAEEHGHSPSSYEWRERVAPSYGAVISRFGSWGNALHEAGLPPIARRYRQARNGTPLPVPSFEERGEGVPLLTVVEDLRLPRKGKSLLDVVKELPERS